MKILVLSDSHGNYPLVLKAIELAGDVDTIMHLGDGIDDAKLVEEILDRQVVKVSGNCDRFSSAPSELIWRVINYTLFLTHGDKYGVKAGFTHLRQKAITENADIVLYGHTHCASIETIGNILFVNPGCLYKNHTPNTCAILTFGMDGVAARIIEIS
jgi:putative phosphoesterase